MARISAPETQGRGGHQHASALISAILLLGTSAFADALPDTSTVTARPSEGITSMQTPAASVPATPPPAPAPAFKAPPAAHRLRTVAVLAFTGPGLAEKDLAAVTSRFETEVIASDSFLVVERRHMDRILKEQGFQQSGACDNSECQVQVGQLLGVHDLFSGELSQVAGVTTLTVKRTDVGTGQTVFSHALDIKGSLGDVLRGGVPEMARIATRQKQPERNHTVLVAEKPLWPWIVGGIAVAGGAGAAVLLLSGKSNTATSVVAPAATDPGTTDLNLSWH